MQLEIVFPFPSARAGVETQAMASVSILPHVASLRARCLQALSDAGYHGLTDFELEAATGIKQTSAGKRRLELQRAGLVDRCMVIDPDTLGLVPGRRPAPSGVWAAVWEITPLGREVCSGLVGVSDDDA